MGSSKIQRQRLIIPSDLNEIPKVEAITEQLTKDADFSESDRDSIAISVTEIVSNAISHGNKCDKSKKVIIDFETQYREFTITVQDQGSGFVPEDVPDPIAKENLYKDSGRGIFIVKALMDKVDFSITDKGMRVLMTKKGEK